MQSESKSRLHSRNYSLVLICSLLFMSLSVDLFRVIILLFFILFDEDPFSLWWIRSKFETYRHILKFYCFLELFRSYWINCSNFRNNLSYWAYVGNGGRLRGILPPLSFVKMNYPSWDFEKNWNIPFKFRKKTVLIA